MGDESRKVVDYNFLLVYDDASSTRQRREGQSCVLLEHKRNLGESDAALQGFSMGDAHVYEGSDHNIDARVYGVGENVGYWSVLLKTEKAREGEQ